MLCVGKGRGGLLLLVPLSALSEVSQPSRQEGGLTHSGVWTQYHSQLSQSQFNSQLLPSQRNWGEAMAKIQDGKGSLALPLPRTNSKAWQLQSTGADRTSWILCF